jgi:hypothetical protein
MLDPDRFEAHQQIHVHDHLTNEIAMADGTQCRSYQGTPRGDAMAFFAAEEEDHRHAGQQLHGGNSERRNDTETWSYRPHGICSFDQCSARARIARDADTARRLRWGSINSFTSSRADSWTSLSTRHRRSKIIVERLFDEYRSHRGISACDGSPLRANAAHDFWI